LVSVFLLQKFSSLDTLSTSLFQIFALLNINTLIKIFSLTKKCLIVKHFDKLKYTTFKL